MKVEFWSCNLVKNDVSTTLIQVRRAYSGKRATVTEMKSYMEREYKFGAC